MDNPHHLILTIRHAIPPPDFGRLLAGRRITRQEYRKSMGRSRRLPFTCKNWPLVARFRKMNFGLAVERSSQFNLTTLETDLEALHSRLAAVTVTCLDFADFIRRVDRSETLFYLDPPYWGCEGDYGKHLFSRDRFEELAAVLFGLNGRFILSLNDVECVRETFNALRFREGKTTYTIAAKGAAPERAEVLISNYDLGSI